MGKATDRDRKLQQALNRNPSTSKPNIGRRKKTKYSSHHKMRKKFEKFSKVNNKKMNFEEFKKQIDAISDNEDDHDRCFERCCKHINYRQFYKDNKEDVFLHNTRKMMRAFGDGPRPSRYAALIVLNHIKAYLKCIIAKLEEYESSNNVNLGSKRTKKSAQKRLDILEKWFPHQVKAYKKWKWFKYEYKKDRKKVPDLVSNENEEDSDYEEETNGSNYMEQIRKSKNNSVVFIQSIGIDIGWGSRLDECDKFATPMDRRQYFKFTKCREASLTNASKRFYKWLAIAGYHKILTAFFGFLAWDRIGCIVQIARKETGLMEGVIIEEQDSFLTPTRIVAAILKTNDIEQITPIEFVDDSFDVIDLSDIQSVAANDDHDDVNEKKRKLTETNIENDNEIKMIDYFVMIFIVLCSYMHNFG